MNKELSQILETQEKLLGVYFFFHDYQGEFIKTIPARYKNHSHPFCVEYKAKHLERCTRFDGEYCIEKSLMYPKGFWKICHANVMELYMPLIHPISKIRIGALFVGIFQAAVTKEIKLAVPLHKSSDKQVQKLELITTEKMQAIYDTALLIQCYIENKILTRHFTLQNTLDRKEQVIFYLKENLTKPISLDQIAEFLNVSYSRAGQIIKDHFSKTFPELMLELRLEHATNLLENSSMSIKQIAIECGFKEPEYFHKVFKRHLSVTPSIFRKDHQQRTTDIPNI